MLYLVFFDKSCVPKGIRTPVAAVKGQCPRPLDDGDLEQTSHKYTKLIMKF